MEKKEGVNHFKEFVSNSKETMVSLTKPEKLTVHAAPYAVEAYKRLGFVATDSERTEDGVRYTPMLLC